MPKKLGTVDRSVLSNASLPAATSTYTVISHDFVIDSISDELKKQGFEIENTEYKCTTGAQVAQGIFTVNYGNDPDLKMIYAFSNSYDKSVRFRCAVGAYSVASGGSMISELDNWKRKHTGTADNETQESIEQHIADAQKYYDSLKADKDAMEKITVSEEEFTGLLGNLYYKNFITLDQFSFTIKEFISPTKNYTTPSNNLWTCYNHILLALKLSHPTKWLQNQVVVHTYIATRYDLAQFDEEEIEDNIGSEEYKDGEDKEDHLNLHEKLEILQKEKAQESYSDSDIQEKVEMDSAAIENTIEENIESIEEAGGVDIEDEPELDDDLKEITANVPEDDLPHSIKNVEGDHQVIPGGDTVATGSIEPPIEIEDLPVNVEYKAEEEIVEEYRDSVPETIEPEEKEESQYVPTGDYPGIDIGDNIELEENTYYTIKEKITIEGDDYFKLVPLDLNAEPIEKVEDTTKSVSSETVPEYQEVTEFNDLETNETSIEEDIVLPAAKLPVTGIIEDSVGEVEAIEDPFEETLEVIPETQGTTSTLEEDPQDPIEEVEKELTELEKRILSEIKETYGQEFKFTYNKNEDDVSVTLETGESMVLSESYLEMVYS